MICSASFYHQKPLQEALEAELEDFLSYPKYYRTDNPNSRNGYTSKTVRTEYRRSGTTCPERPQ